MLTSIVKSIRDSFRKLYMENKWRKANTHNFTKAGRIFPISIVMVGMNTYGVINVHYYKQKAESLIIWFLLLNCR